MIEYLPLLDSRNTIRTLDQDDVIIAESGNDRIFAGLEKICFSVTGSTGEAGDDELYGSARGNFLAGGAGDDTLRGGAGNDTLTGDGDYRSDSSPNYAPVLGSYTSLQMRIELSALSSLLLNVT